MTRTDEPPAQRRTQAQRRADSERRLLDASAELIVEQGLENTSLADIGRRAGASHAAVNHRFGSKDELVDRLIDKAAQRYSEIARARIGHLDGLDAVLELGALYLDMVDGPDPLGRVHVVLWSEAIAHTAERRAAHLDWDRRFRRVYAALLRVGIEEGSVDPRIHVEEVALSIVGTVRGIAMQLLLDPDHADLAVAQATLRALVHSAVAAPADAAAELRPPASG
ncbi:TetR/AcrR family transcriptional regulator [Marmoricola sp. RAF53]|uniref:TetR/AcrR family transcriptional regulator n=1 Tax=Marmoricola sp. RAF53 TaxID=3233059 RepID=UPI003F9D0DD4